MTGADLPLWAAILIVVLAILGAGLSLLGAGVLGVALLVLTPGARLDGWGIVAGLGSAVTDLDVIPPSLEDIYSHFSRREGQ